MTLTGTQILQRLRDRVPEHRLYIVPVQQNSIALEEASIDLHLGHYFLLPRRARQDALDPGDEKSILRAREVRMGSVHPSSVGMEALWLPDDGKLVLQPRDFLLAATLEYIGLPPDLCAQVLGRSRWSRVGLIAEMASFVHPGYRGCLTLEMQNLGSTAIILRPRLPVAHLVISETTSDPYIHTVAAQIVCSIRPQVLPLLP